MRCIIGKADAEEQELTWAVLIHGGAGVWGDIPESEILAGVEAAAHCAGRMVGGGATALDAVVEAVALLEDNPWFNAGTGSVLNRDGEAEMDASVMRGHDLACGAVAALARVRNPVRVAHRVMERTAHVMLAGEGALRFARAEGFPDYDPVTERARARWAQRREQLERGGTVGAVALDRQGRLAAATSTGGTALKLPGRVGDSPIPGAGTYATPHAAASCTGQGELMMRVLAAKVLCDRVAAGNSPGAATEGLLAEMRTSVGADAGFILVSPTGALAAAHGTESMPHAWWREGEARPQARMRC